MKSDDTPQRNNQVASKYETTDLFGHTEQLGRKHKTSHWTYYRRVIHLLHEYHEKTKGKSKQWKHQRWQNLYKLIDNNLNPSYRVNSWKLNNAVKHMRIYKTTPNQQRNSNVSIRKIAKSFDVSLPTLYRAYYRKFGK